MHLLIHTFDELNNDTFTNQHLKQKIHWQSGKRPDDFNGNYSHLFREYIIENVASVIDPNAPLNAFNDIYFDSPVSTINNLISRTHVM